MKNIGIVRPYITYSNARLQLGTMEKELWLFRALHGKSVIVPEDVMEHTTTMTYGLDVAKSIASLIANEKAYGKAVHITGESSKKWKNVLNIYFDAIEEKMGKRPQVKLLQNSDELMKIMHNDYQVKYDRLYDRVFDNSLADQLCGHITYLPMELGLKKCINEFLEGEQEFRLILWRFEGWADRKSLEHGVLAFWITRMMKTKRK